MVMKKASEQTLLTAYILHAEIDIINSIKI